MKLSEHVIKAIEDYGLNKDSALMHACFAIEATSRNLYKKRTVGRNDYINCLRKYYWIIEFMIGKGLNLGETKWDNLIIINDHGKKINHPDLAEVVYYIFRCNHAHAKPVPFKYKLLPYTDGHFPWQFGANLLQMPESIIWALLAISVFSTANKGIRSKGDHYLTWGSESLGIGTTTFKIMNWWGKEDKFREFVDKNTGGPRVKIVYQKN